MRVINFAHPLTQENHRQIEILSGCTISEVIDVPSQIDSTKPLEPQIEAMLDGLGLTALQWQTEPLLINPPSLNHSAAVLLAQLHGRMGYFPPILRQCAKNQGLGPHFEVVEILNLQAICERAREKRTR